MNQLTKKLSTGVFQLLLLIYLVNMTACGGHEIVKEGEYQKVARINYEFGLEEFKDENMLEARRFFEHVKNHYPYSLYAAISELRLADCDFEEGQFELAVNGYRDFIRFHPQHQEVGYAMYRVADAYFEQVPADLFFMPPTHEKDLVPTQNALQALQSYLNRFPDQKNASQAKDRIKICIDELAAHEFYVAKFYRSREKWSATAKRLQRLITLYPETSDAPEAWWLMGEAYVYDGKLAKARTAYRTLNEKFPKNQHQSEAKQILSRLDSKLAK
jgi:outer membrane protein assembly factor BamD